MKNLISSIFVLATFLSPFADASDKLTCTGSVSGIDFLDNENPLSGSYPVQVVLEKESPTSDYVLSYVGPAYSLGNTDSGFTVTLKKSELKKFVFTTGSHFSILLENQTVGSHFSLELDANKLAHQVTGDLTYSDGKPLNLSGTLICN